MLPAIFGLVFLWIKSDVTLIAPWPMLMLFIFFANLLIVAAGWKYLGVTRSDRQAQAILMFLAVFEPLLTYKVLIAEGTNLTPWVQIACYCAGTGCCLGHNRLGARDIRLFYAATLG